MWALQIAVCCLLITTVVHTIYINKLQRDIDMLEELYEELIDEE